MASGGSHAAAPGGIAPVGAPAGVHVDLEKKEAYYLRMHFLIVKEVTALLRACFDLIVPPQQLHATIQNYMTTLNYAKNTNLLNKTQWDFLFPQYNPPSSDTFDVSLLAYLLRNICELTSKWWNETDNSKIPDSEVTIEADIVRLRNLRNNMQQKPIASLEPVEFEDMWDTAEKVMLRLAAKLNIRDQKKTIDDLKTRQLDLVTDGMRSIRANTELFLQDYQDDIHYIETAAYQKAMRILKDKHMVILTGHPGEGKTNMAARLALHVSQSPRNCLNLVSPSDWRQIDLSLKLFDTIIIDDIFGAGALDQKLLEDWRYHLEEIERAVKKKAVRVIVTSRHYIYEEAKEELGSVPMFTEDNEALLLLTSFELSSDEKRKILKMQAEKNVRFLENETIHECVEAFKGPTEEVKDFLFGFPECASMFVRNKTMLDEGASFFKKPAQFLKTYLEDLYRGKEQEIFLALVTVWASDDKKVSQKDLRNKESASDHVKKVAKIFGHNVSPYFLYEMRLSLDSHVGGYLVFTESTKEYTFSHNVIADMVGLVIGSKEPEKSVEICPRDFLMEFVLIEEGMRDDFKVLLLDNEINCLIVKCVKMLLRDNFNQDVKEIELYDFQELSRPGRNYDYIYINRMIDFGIIKHKAFSSEIFVKKFIDYIIEKNLVNKCFSVPVMILMGHFFDSWKHMMKLDINIEKLNMCLIGYAWYIGATIFAKEVMTRRVLGEENVDLSVHLLLAVHSRQKDSVEFLLRHGAKVTGDTIYIASHNSVELLEILLKHPKTNVNDKGNAINGNFPLIVAAEEGLTEAVKCMLNAGADAGVQNTEHKTALYKAIQYKRKDIIRLLIDAGAPLDIKGGKFNITPLHLAVHLNEMEVVEVLLEKGASVMVKDLRGHFPIHIAAIKGRTDILRALYLADPSQDKLLIACYGTESGYVINGHSLFHIAVLKKNEELLDALIGLNADPNVNDFYNQTPLYFAIMRTQESFINKLLNFGRTDKRKPQNQGITPLHAAISKGLYNIAKRLALDVDVNVNARDDYGKTALHLACEKVNVGLIKTLLATGAYPEIHTNRGENVYAILARSKKNLSAGRSDEAKCAGQVISEFVKKMINKFDTAHLYEDEYDDHLGACASIEDMYFNPKSIKRKYKKKKKKICMTITATTFIKGTKLTIIERSRVCCLIVCVEIANQMNKQLQM